MLITDFKSLIRKNACVAARQCQKMGSDSWRGFCLTNFCFSVKLESQNASTLFLKAHTHST